MKRNLLSPVKRTGTFGIGFWISLLLHVGVSCLLWQAWEHGDETTRALQGGSGNFGLFLSFGNKTALPGTGGSAGDCGRAGTAVSRQSGSSCDLPALRQETPSPKQNTASPARSEDVHTHSEDSKAVSHDPVASTTSAEREKVMPDASVPQRSPKVALPDRKAKQRTASRAQSEKDRETPLRNARSARTSAHPPKSGNLPSSASAQAARAGKKEAGTGQASGSGLASSHSGNASGTTGSGSQGGSFFGGAGGTGSGGEEAAFGGTAGPSFLRFVRPDYPAAARRRGIEGLVILRVFINERGKAEKIEVVETVDERLSRAAVVSMERSVFVPYSPQGKPRSCWSRIPVRFRLQ